jgi:hypothetical protein
LEKLNEEYNVINKKNPIDYIEEDIVKSRLTQDNYDRLFSAEKFERLLLQNQKKKHNIFDRL